MVDQLVVNQIRCNGFTLVLNSYIAQVNNKIDGRCFASSEIEFLKYIINIHSLNLMSSFLRVS